MIGHMLAHVANFVQMREFLANARSREKSSPAAGFKYAAMGSGLLGQMTSGINGALRDLSIPLGFSRFGHF